MFKSKFQINTDLLSEMVDQEFLKNNLNDKKINLNIKSEDLVLLDELANYLGCTKSKIVTYIVHEMIRDELKSSEDEQVISYLSEIADNRCHYSQEKIPWKYSFRDIGLDSQTMEWNLMGKPKEDETELFKFIKGNFEK